MKRIIIFIMLLFVTIAAWGQWHGNWYVNESHDPFEDKTILIMFNAADRTELDDKVITVGATLGESVTGLFVFIQMKSIIRSNKIRVRFGDNTAGYVKGEILNNGKYIVLPLGTIYELLQVNKLIVQISTYSKEDIMTFDLTGLKELCVTYGLTDKKNPNYYLD